MSSRKPHWPANHLLSKAASAVIAALLLSACGSMNQNSSPSNPPASGSSSAADGSTEELQDYAFYFVSETAQGFRLVREVHQVSKVENDLGDDKGLNSLVMLVNGQLPPFDGDHRTLWNNGTKVNSVTTVDGVATVDLTLGRISLGAESEQRAIDQIVWTLIGNDPTITSVKFTVDGVVSETLAGHLDFSQAFIPAAGFDVLASVVEAEVFAKSALGSIGSQLTKSNTAFGFLLTEGLASLSEYSLIS